MRHNIFKNANGRVFMTEENPIGEDVTPICKRGSDIIKQLNRLNPEGRMGEDVSARDKQEL